MSDFDGATCRSAHSHAPPAAPPGSVDDAAAAAAIYCRVNSINQSVTFHMQQIIQMTSYYNIKIHIEYEIYFTLTRLLNVNVK